MTEKQQATIGEYNNYFSEGVFVELTEPLFVKKSWVPQWFWNLVSEPRLSYFEYDKPSIDPAAEAQVSSAKVPHDIGPWDTYNFKYNNGVNDPSHLIDNKGDS